MSNPGGLDYFNSITNAENMLTFNPDISYSFLDLLGQRVEIVVNFEYTLSNCHQKKQRQITLLEAMHRAIHLHRRWGMLTRFLKPLISD